MLGNSDFPFWELILTISLYVFEYAIVHRSTPSPQKEPPRCRTIPKRSTSDWSERWPIPSASRSSRSSPTGSPAPTGSPMELEVGLTHVAYHTRALDKCGCLELVDTAQRRGATEHFYKAAPDSFVGNRSWRKVPRSVLPGVSGGHPADVHRQGRSRPWRRARSTGATTPLSGCPSLDQTRLGRGRGDPGRGDQLLLRRTCGARIASRAGAGRRDLHGDRRRQLRDGRVDAELL